MTVSHSNSILHNYSKLVGRITEKFGTQAEFAKAMKLSERSISLKLNNKIEWKQDEILRASKLLGFPQIEISDYFFKFRIKKGDTSRKKVITE